MSWENALLRPKVDNGLIIERIWNWISNSAEGLEGVKGFRTGTKK